MRPFVRAGSIAVFLTAMLLLSASCSAAPAVSGYVAPSAGDVNDQYVFVMKYTGTVPIATATVHINGDEHPMTEVDPDDHNTTNGKEYAYKTALPQGANVFFFEAVDSGGNSTTSAAYAISVDSWFDFGHTDIAVVMAALAVPLLYAVYLLRRTTRALERLGKGGRPGGKEPEAETPKEKKDA